MSAAAALIAAQLLVVALVRNALDKKWSGRCRAAMAELDAAKSEKKESQAVVAAALASNAIVQAELDRLVADLVTTQLLVERLGEFVSDANDSRR